MLAAAQAEILDGFAGKAHLELRAAYRAAHAEVVGLIRERDELAAREGARERDIDLLRFELGEIDEAAIEADEQESLEAERDRLRHAESLRDGAGTALLAIAGGEEGGGATGLLAEAEAALGRGAGVDPALDALTERAVAAGVELTDLAGELRSYVDGIEADPGRLEGIETRLDAIDRLMRKHGGSVEAVLAHAEHCRTELDRLERAAERGGELTAALAEAEARREKLGAKLTKSRRAAAPKLEKQVAAELAELAMDGARLEVALEPVPGGYGPSGREVVELRVATNPGMPIAPLSDAASGGELSRVMLSLSGLGPAARSGRSSSTRSTPASAARSPAGSASGSSPSARAARSSASPTSPRSPPWRRPTSGSRRRPTARRPSPASRRSPATSSWRRSSACSAPTPATRPPAATRGNC